MSLDIFSDKPVSEVLEEKKEVSRTHFPEEVKLEAYSLFLQGMSTTDIASRIGASQASVYKWIRNYRNRFKDEIEAQTGVDLLSAVMEEYEFLKNLA